MKFISSYGHANPKKKKINLGKGACTKDVHSKGGRGGFGVVDENGQGGRGGLSQMDVHF